MAMVWMTWLLLPAARIRWLIVMSTACLFVARMTPFLGFCERQSNIELCPDAPERRGVCLLISHGTSGALASRSPGKFPVDHLPLKPWSPEAKLKKRMAVAIY